MEKVERYRAKNGRLYETAKEAVLDDFSGDSRAKKIAASINCGAPYLVWSLWKNRRSVRSLLKDMEIVLNDQENQ